MPCSTTWELTKRQTNCWPDCKSWRALIFSRVCESVCLSVCLWPALLPFSVNRFWRNLVTRTLLWSSLAATIMVQIGPQREHATPFWKFQKILNNLIIKILVHHFFASVSPVYCKKIRLNSNKTDGGDTGRFWSLPLWWFWQWHCCSSTTLAGIL